MPGATAAAAAAEAARLRKEQKRLKKEARKNMVAAALSGVQDHADKKAAKKAVMALIRQANAEKIKQAQAQERLMKHRKLHRQQQQQQHGGAGAATAPAGTAAKAAGSDRKQQLRAARKAAQAQQIEVFKSKSQVVVSAPGGSSGADKARWESTRPCITTAQAQCLSKPVKGTLKSVGFSSPTPLQGFAWPVLAAPDRDTARGVLVASAAGTEVSRLLAYLAPVVERVRRLSAVGGGGGGTSGGGPGAAASGPPGTDDAASQERRRQPPRALFVMPSKARCLLLAKYAAHFERAGCGVRVTALTGSSAVAVPGHLGGSARKRKKRKKRRGAAADAAGDAAAPATGEAAPAPPPATRAEQLAEIYKFRCDAICTTPGNLHEALKDGDFPLYGVAVVVLDDIQTLMDRGFAPQLDTLFQYLAHLPLDSRRQRHAPVSAGAGSARDSTVGTRGTGIQNANPTDHVQVVLATTAPTDGTWARNLPLMSPTSKEWLRRMVRIRCTAAASSPLTAAGGGGGAAAAGGGGSALARDLPAGADKVVHLVHVCTASGAAERLAFLAALVRREVDVGGGGGGSAPPVNLASLNRAERRAHLARQRKQRSQLAVVVRRDHASAVCTLLRNALGVTATDDDADGSGRTTVAVFGTDGTGQPLRATVVVAPYEAVAELAAALDKLGPVQRRPLAGAVLFDSPPSVQSYDRVVAVVGTGASNSSSVGGGASIVAAAGKGKLHVVVDVDGNSAEQKAVVARALTRYGAAVPAFVAAPASKRKLEEAAPADQPGATGMPNTKAGRLGGGGMELNIVNTAVARAPPAAHSDAVLPVPVRTAGGWIDRRERRFGPDGVRRTRSEFQRHFGGTDEWTAAAPQAPGAALPPPSQRSLPQLQRARGVLPPSASGGLAWTDKRERRLAGDGKLHTRKEFQQLYGGTAEWNSAPRRGSDGGVALQGAAVVPASPTAAAPTTTAAASGTTGQRVGVNRDGKTFIDKRERRYADDGQLYTRSQFQKFYGGTVEWNVARPQQ